MDPTPLETTEVLVGKSQVYKLNQEAFNAELVNCGISIDPESIVRELRAMLSRELVEKDPLLHDISDSVASRQAVDKSVDVAMADAVSCITLDPRCCDDQ